MHTLLGTDTTETQKFASYLDIHIDIEKEEV
jgi:hypothetical protein